MTDHDPNEKRINEKWDRLWDTLLSPTDEEIREENRRLKTEAVLDELGEERAAQFGAGWTPEHDDTNSHQDMASLTIQRLGSALSYFRFTEQQRAVDPPSVRASLVQTAALIVAWIEKIDREQE